jgi:hypothetical protein
MRGKDYSASAAKFVKLWSPIQQPSCFQRVTSLFTAHPPSFTVQNRRVAPELEPGYRVYYIQRGEIAIVLLCGGDKSTQDNDIQKAKAMAAQIAIVE